MSKELLREEGDNDAESGVINPAVSVSRHDVDFVNDDENQKEEENEKAKTLVKDLKKKRRKKQKQLEDELTSPKEDLSLEIRTAKRIGQQKLRETLAADMQPSTSTEPPHESEKSKYPLARISVEEDGTVPFTSMTARTADTTQVVDTSADFEPRMMSSSEWYHPVSEEPLQVHTQLTVASEPFIPNARTSLDASVGETDFEESLKSKKDSKKPESRSSRMSKFQNRLKEAKVAGKDEAKKEEKATLLKKQKSSEYSFEDIHEKERKMQEKASRLRQRWKQYGQREKYSQRDDEVTAEEAYDFFTKVWESEPDVERATLAQTVTEENELAKDEQTEIGEKEIEEAKDDEGTSADDKVKTSEDDIEDETTEPAAGTSEETMDQPVEEPKFMDLRNMEEMRLLDDVIDSYVITVPGKPIAGLTKEQEEKRNSLIYIPSSVATPCRQKIFSQAEPRYIEDEGFYVGVRTPMKQVNVNRLENRLLKQPDKGCKWFGEDGRIKFLPNPVAVTPTRPPMSELIDPALETTYKKAILVDSDGHSIDGSMDSGGEYQIDIDINSITFTHHHLFSEEHVLASELTKLYDQYIQCRRRNLVEFLTEKLKALKVSVFNLSEMMSSNKRDMSAADRENYTRRLADYKHEIRHTSSLRDMEESVERSLLKRIFLTWKNIKSTRSSQGHTSTSLRLQIRKENTDREAEVSGWNQDLNDAVDEEMTTRQKEYDEKFAVYTQLKEKYDNQRAEKKAAKKRQKKRSRLAAKMEAEATAETEATADENPEGAIHDQQLLDEPDEECPTEPEKPDREIIYDTIEAKMKETRRHPGEPKLFPVLSHTATITQTSQCHKTEQLRRDLVSKYKMFIKVLFNNKEVTSTGYKTMSQDFKVNFGHIYNLKIVHWPQNIKFEIYEGSGLSKNLVAHLYCPVPEASVTSSTMALDMLDFSSDHHVQHPQTSAVGSGVAMSLTSSTQSIRSLTTSGLLCCSVGWAVYDDGSPMVPVLAKKPTNFYTMMRRLDPVAGIGVSGMADIDKLSEWISQSRLDPNDPANADIVYLFKPRDSSFSMSKMANYFRLEQLQKEFNFMTDEEFDSQKRFRLIYLRSQEVTEFKNLKNISILEREIPRDAFTEYEKRIMEREQLEKDGVKTHQKAVAQFMERVREQVLRRWKLAAHQKKLDEMVVEDAVPNITMLGLNLAKFFQPARPLRPKRKERKKITTVAIKGEDICILINITRAFDIPTRRTNLIIATTSGLVEGESKGSKAGEDTVLPFVEVTFQRKSARTSVAEGPNPSFNEDLKLIFRAPNDDYSPGNLQRINDKIYINLFDQVSVDILEDDRLRETNIHRRLEKKWLGSIEIPFSTIYNNGKIDGTFRLNSPPVLLGYHQSNRTPSEMDTDLHDRSGTYLSMFITIEPPLVVAEQIQEKLMTFESEELLLWADHWKNDLEQKFAKRHYRTTVIDISGKTVFVTRYFQPLAPPPQIGTTDEDIARFVSLIPYASDNILFPGVCDIWARSDEFLSMLSGDEEEHAVLLVNYLLAQNKITFLILGSAIPEGESAFVLSTDSNHDFVIWNPKTGRKYRCTDAFCPLRSVWTLTNGDNIWANIQASDEPWRMSFDVSNKSFWKPLFTRQRPNPSLTSVQPDNLDYFPTDTDYVQDLKEKIEQTLKNKIMEWRQPCITRWNRHCNQTFRMLLPKLEETRGEGISEQHLSELDQFRGSYKISGFPMNMPFNDVSSIVETIYSTGVHACDTSEVEFALAVYIYPYPNSILSVWIYIASLIRLR